MFLLLLPVYVRDRFFVEYHQVFLFWPCVEEAYVCVQDFLEFLGVKLNLGARTCSIRRLAAIAFSVSFTASATDCSLAGTLGLSKLIVLYDDNGISIDGEVEGWFKDDTPKRFEAYGWHVIPSVDGHDVAAIDAAITKAKGSNKPT